MKILDRGYWVSQHFYWQSMCHYLANGVRFKSMTYFSACNPAIALGGMLHDRKTDIYSLLPKHIVPFTSVIASRSDAEEMMQQNNLSFPVIIKPNVGLKGFKVYKINCIKEFSIFFDANDVSEREWLLQEYLDHEQEFSVLFYKYPLEKSFGISSLVNKEYPFVVGDGKTTLGKLIKKYKNPFLQKTSILKKYENDLNDIVPEGKKIILDYIGNYSRGAKFYSLMDKVDSEMSEMLADLFKEVKGLNFFRIDFKANSISSFKEGHFKVLEINGMKSEPLHIYDPKSQFLTNVKVIKEHWGIISKLTKQQQSLAIELPSFKQGLKSLRLIKKMVK